eukprot:scaffold41132_cov298-Amphora_coffeaeformis.AAC.1
MAKEGGGGSRSMGRPTICFSVAMVILSFVNLYRTQVLLTRLEQYQQHSDCHQLQIPFPSSFRARGKSHRMPKKTDEIVARPLGEANVEPGDNKEGSTLQVENRPVYFLRQQDLNSPSDAFSATFWQSKERFLRITLSPIQSVEEAVFEQLRERTPDGKVNRLDREIRMTVDWLDFSVEHLSKWWRTMEYDKGPSPIAYHSIVHKLLSYIERIPSQIPVVSDAMPKTVAVIAFAPYDSSLHPEWGQALTVVNVAATVASLIRHGIGRVVVVGQDTTGNHENQALVQAAFRLVQSRRNPSSPLSDWEKVIPRFVQEEERRLAADISRGSSDMRIDQTSVAFANVSTTYSWIVEETNQTKYMTLVPKAALEHLHEALRGQSNDPGVWLGYGKTPDDYRYVYLTEPDTILQTRPSAIESIRQQMDEGNFLTPHRLQPAPHKTDVPGYKDNRRWIPNYGIMSNITTLFSDTDACCDDGLERPKDAFPKCDSNWWACGYTRERLTEADRVAKHMRVHPYALIRLGDPGSDVVLHAATNHGRRCLPRKNAVCPPP